MLIQIEINSKNKLYSGFEILTAVVMNVAMFCDIAPCCSYVNRRFGGIYHLHLQGRKSTKKETIMVPSHTDFTALYITKWQYSKQVGHIQLTNPGAVETNAVTNMLQKNISVNVFFYFFNSFISNQNSLDSIS
jgi:hypothetical protein